MIRQEWLQAVSADAPCGPNLEYDQEFLALEQAARGKEEQQYGDTVIPAEEPDWVDVIDKASTRSFARSAGCPVSDPRDDNDTGPDRFARRPFAGT